MWKELYPVPQNAPHVSAGMNVLELPKGQRPKATDVSPWYGVYRRIDALGRDGVSPSCVNNLDTTLLFMRR